MHFPFSLYFGWTNVLYCLTAFEAFGVNALTHKPGFFTKLFVCLALVFLQVPENFGIGITTTWSLFAIFARTLILSIFTLRYADQMRVHLDQHNPFIHWSVLAFSIISLLFTLVFVSRCLWFPRSGGTLHDDERAPILPDN